MLLDDNNTVSLGSRSIAQGKRTLEIATRLGIAERMTEKGVHWSKGNTLIGDRIIYSFDLLPEGNEKYQAFLALPQYYVESILIERARELGCVDIRWLSRVVAVAQDDDAVRLDVATPEGGYAIRADWVIACDGVRSQVRQALGIAVRRRELRRQVRHLRRQDGVQIPAAAHVLVRAHLRQEQHLADAPAARFDLAHRLAARAR